MTTNSDLFNSILRAPILPTVFPAGAEVLCRYADALAAEGYPALEVLARPLDEALAAMREVFARPQRQVVKWGLGTLRSRDAAVGAVELRPDFLVSPAFSRRVLDVATEAGIPYIPAVHTFQDVQDVIDAFEEKDLEVRILKLCPVYGVTREYVQSLCGCFPGITFCPTGEVTLENYVHWKSTPGIAAPMGSRFVPREILEAGDVQPIRDRLRQLRRLSEEAENSRG